MSVTDYPFLIVIAEYNHHHHHHHRRLENVMSEHGLSVKKLFAAIAHPDDTITPSKLGLTLQNNFSILRTAVIYEVYMSSMSSI